MGTLLKVERGPMVFTNTSLHPDAAVRLLVMFAAREMEVEDWRLEVRVTGCSWSCRGRAMGRRRVLLRIGAAARFPLRGVKYPGLVTAPEHDLEDWQEGLVQLAAHEFQHIRQIRAQVRCSEIEAEKVSLYVLKKFRAMRAVVDAEIAQLLGREETKKQDRAARRAQAKVNASDPRTKLASVFLKEKAWQRKAKLAATKLKKLAAQRRRFERMIGGAS